MTAEFSYLFSAANGMAIGAGITQIRTAGYSTAGNGGAFYVYDAAVDSAFVSANPRWSFVAADDRGFRLNEPIVNPLMFGAVPDNATDCFPAITAMLAYMDRYVITNIAWPEGEFFCGSTIQLKQQIILNGPSAGMEPGVTGGENNFLRFPANKAGIVLNRYNMLNGVEVPVHGGRADASIIRGLHLKGGGGTSSENSSGIISGVRVKIEDCFIHGFAGHGIFINGRGGGFNANCWRIDTVRLVGNTKSGLYLNGPDANAGISTLVDASNNGEWGIHDDSFLGNRHEGFHMEANAFGAWKTDGQNGIFWMDGYTETGQPVAVAAASHTIWSGPQFSGVQGGSGLDSAGLDGGGLSSSDGFYSRKDIGGNVFHTGMGRNESQAEHFIWTGYGRAWRLESIVGGGFVINEGNHARALTVSIPPDRVTYSVAAMHLLIAGHDGDVNTRSRRLATVGAAPDLIGTLVQIGDTFPLHTPVLGGPERLIAIKYGVLGTGSGEIVSSGIVGGVQMTALADLSTTATLAETVAYLKALVVKLRAARQMSSSAPYAGFDFAFDPKNGFYRNRDLLTTDITAMPGYSFTGTGPSITLGVGYSADAGDRLAFTRTVQAAPMLFYAVGTTRANAGQSDVLTELQNGAATQRHVLYRAGDANLNLISSVFGPVYSEHFAHGATRIAMATWSDGTNHKLMVKVGETVYPAASIASATTTGGLDRIAVGGSGYADEEFRGNVEFIGLRYGTFTDSDVTAILAAA